MKRKLMIFCFIPALLTVFLIHLEAGIKNNDNTSKVNSVEPLIKNQWTTFTWPYNAYLPLKGNGERVGNACGYNSIARLLHYWQYPVNGTEEIDFTDYFGVDWYCDLENLNLNYLAMPSKLPYSATKEEYHETATLFLAASAVGEKIGIGYSDGPEKVADAMEKYFNFKNTGQLINRWDYSKEEWVEIFKNEIDNGRPIIVVGRTPDSPAPWEQGNWQGHWWICDGYNENDEFYSDYAFNEIRRYDDIDNLGGVYTAYNSAIIGLEPDLNGKSITFNSFSEREAYSNTESIEITWDCDNIDNLKLEYSTDAGYNWLLIDENIDASLKSFNWSPPSIDSEDCLIKLTDESDENIYKISNKFSIINLANALPKEPFNPYPANNSINVSLNPTISWREGENAETLDLYLGKENPPIEKVLDSVSKTTQVFRPDKLEENTTYYWKVVCRNNYGEAEGEVWSFTTEQILTAVENISLIPNRFALAQNYPNPFNPTTIIEYSVPQFSFVEIKVYDILGKEVAVLVYENKSPGVYSVQFDSGKLKSGVYFYSMKSGSFVGIRKLILLK